MNIRSATNQDLNEIRRIYSSAFPASEREMVSQLAVDLLSESTVPPTISFVAETGHSVAGHVAFSPVRIAKREDCRAYILGPLAVQPDHQKQGVGSMLVEYGIQQLLASGTNVILVYGDPKYYGRFGFDVDVAQNYTPPYELEYSFGWQALILKECAIAEAPVAISCVASLCHPELW